MASDLSGFKAVPFTAEPDTHGVNVTCEVIVFRRVVG